MLRGVYFIRIYALSFLCTIMGCGTTTWTTSNEELLENNKFKHTESNTPFEHLTSFEAISFSNFIEITWETSAEIGILHYELQRKTASLTFETIETLEAFGMSETSDYLFPDSDILFNSSLQYRLKIVGIRDTFYSDPITLLIEKPVEAIELIQYPTRAYQALSFNGKAPHHIGELTVFNAAGNPVLKKSIPIKIGLNYQKINLQAQPKGIYFLHFESPKFSWDERLLKMHG